MSKVLSRSNADNRVKEIEVTGSGGPVQAAEEISFLVELGETASALRFFYLDNNNKAFLANANTTYENSQTIGILKQGGTTGAVVEALLFGKLSDPFFNFPIGADLYLSTSGNITANNPQVIGLLFHKVVAQSLGSGAIFINIKNSIIL